MNLHDKLEIEHCWTTPIGKIHIYLPDEIRQTLIMILTKQVNYTTSESYDQINKVIDVMPLIYNLFDYSEKNQTENYKVSLDLNEDEIKCLKEFEKISSKIIRTYINKAWDFDEDVEIKVRCFGNVQKTGARTYPHYHQDINGVLVHYLKMGDEDKDLAEQLYVDREKSPRHGTHTVIFQDPRPAISYPYWEKIHAIVPRIGLTIIHPNYLWHETNPWLGKGTRVCIVVNFRIVSHGYNELLKPLKG